MSTSLPTPEADQSLHRAFTPLEHTELGLNPNTSQIYSLPPLPSSPAQPVPSSSLVSPSPPLTYYPMLYLHPTYLHPLNSNRHLCDFYGPYYEPNPPLWTPENEEIPDLDEFYNANFLRFLAQEYPPFRPLISIADPNNSKHVKKVFIMIREYIRQDYHRSLGATPVNPQLTWQDPWEGWQERVNLEGRIPGTHSQLEDLGSTADGKPKLKHVGRRPRRTKRGVVFKVPKRTRRGQLVGQERNI
ncbi:hypothetical protein AX15_006690 [Amanita polypyramis BW_CC]|nr:hypothetical protein AX15_006690 [Amanita polypyramis BW_CC]